MMPEKSFLGHFSSEGRLKNLWAKGLEDQDPEKGMNTLREVLQRIAERLDTYAHICLPFLDTLLDAARVLLLTEEDLACIENLGDTALEFEEPPVRPEDIWGRLIRAFDKRGEKEAACRILTRVYDSPSTKEEIKRACARSLAGRLAKSDDHLRIYMDHLQRAAEPSAEAAVLDLLASIVAVDFNSEKVLLKRAGEVAQRLFNNNIEIPGLLTALGLYKLVIQGDPCASMGFLERATSENPRDKTAVIAALSAATRAGDYERVDAIAGASHFADDPVVRAISLLCRTLVWLDDRDIPDSPPYCTRDFAGLDVYRYVGDTLYAAMGRLHLLEGDADMAAHALLPYAEAHPEEPRWRYYCAWTAVLRNDVGMLTEQLERARDWGGAWTVACMLLDLNPSIAEKKREELFAYLYHPSPAYGEMVRIRLALSRMENTEDLKQDPGKAVTEKKAMLRAESSSIEEDMEALRTMLGYAIYINDVDAARGLAEQPLFKRLPSPDQLMWRGLISLLIGRDEEGLSLLKKAADDHGYYRASAILAIYELQKENAPEAARFLGGSAPWDKGVKGSLIGAWIDLLENRFDACAGRLEKLAARGEARAQYALGNLYLYCGERARVEGEPGRYERYLKQAAGAFSSALEAEPSSVPGDCEALKRCVELMADPGQGEAGRPAIWDNIAGVDASRWRPWVGWLAALERIWYGDASALDEACGEIVALLSRADEVEPTVLTIISQATARAALNSDASESLQEPLQILEKISARDHTGGARRFQRLAITAVNQTRLAGAGAEDREEIKRHLEEIAETDPGNASNAVLRAKIHLEDDMRAWAVDALREVDPESGDEEQLCACLGSLLAGEPLSEESLPPPPEGASPKEAQAYHVLRALGSFVAGNPDRGYEELLSAMRDMSDGFRSVIGIEEFLPCLCAHSLKSGSVPVKLIDMIYNISKNAGCAREAVTVARCAAAIGENEHACSLWEDALTEMGDPEPDLLAEYAALLCHLAVLAYNSGDGIEAARNLRRAVACFSGVRDSA